MRADAAPDASGPPTFALHEEWRPRHFVLIAGVGALEAVARAQVPQAQDIYWEAQYGLDVIRNGSIPRTDTVSWTAHGATWIPSSWAWNVVLGAVYDVMSIAGFWMLALLGSVAVALAVALAARRIGARPLATIVTFIPLAFLAELAIPRAQMVSNVAILLLPVLLRPLMYADRRGAVRAFALLAALQTAWMNLHSMALLGPPVVAAGCGGLLVQNFRDRRWTGFTRAVAATALASGCCVLTPYGVSQLTHASEVRSASTGLIVEWNAVGLGTGPQIVGLGAVLALALAARAAWLRRGADIAAPLLLLTVLGATAIRFIPMGALLAIPEVALLLGRLDVRRRFFGFVALLGSIGLIALATANWRDVRRLEPVVSPSLVALVPTGCRVLNDDLVGDALILERPDVKVSLDGRNDMYGRSGVLRVVRLLDDRVGTDRELSAERVGCVLAPSELKLVRRLRVDQRWTIRGQDALRTLLVRRS